MRPLEISGVKFGRLTAVRRLNRKERGAWVWECVCDHDNPGIDPVTVEVAGGKLKDGAVKSCGCLRRDTSTAHGKAFRTHGMSQHPLYQVWRNMKSRCLDKKRKDYKYYGGRGIGVCLEWMKSDNFFAWAGESGYKEGLTIERKNNNRNYSPSNCYWAPMKTQIRNRECTIMVTVRGKRAPLAEHCETYGIHYSVAVDHIKRGWDADKALTSPVDRHRKRHHTINRVLVEK